ncbi:hypothetical protein ACELLULO517_05520 [Acidisoma cellulosilytica]|uniref:SLATT domain-containing protein n=1 Tax=Acidisoma cellulosilyticum TaxID=2802395 RepID=A0A963Z0N2_9PROT|nr:hypothetical protein [Acidisoma cellulosilyticum]MCB8879683.1 hypothetical protein [Acidisoma cellulosilyticum]
MTQSNSSEKLKSWPEPAGYTLQDHDLMMTLWDCARNARLSELYYGESGAQWSRWNFIIELTIATTASGSGISGLAIVKYPAIAAVWPWLAGVTALLAIAKPLVAIDRKLRHASQQQQTYRRLLGTFENLAFDVQQAGTLTAEHRQRFQRARDILRQAEELDDGAIKTSKLQPLEARVRKEMPADRLWVPEARAGDALA